MFYGLVELLFNAVTEFHRLAPSHFTFWLGFAALGALVMECIFFLSGRLIHINWVPERGIGTLAGLVLPLSFALFLSWPASAYLKPAVMKILVSWQKEFLADQNWNHETFRKKYWAVRALKGADNTPLENFTNYPPPEDGGHLIPASELVTKDVMANIDSRRVEEHFQKHYALLAKLLWTYDYPFTTVIRDDMDKFFRENPGKTHEHSRSVQLASIEMQNLLEKKTGRIIVIMRITLILILMALWLPLCAWAMYDAWKKLEPITGKL